MNWLNNAIAKVAAVLGNREIPPFLATLQPEGLQRNYGPGHTQAHVKRMARKRSNQQRNRKAHRG